MATSTLTDVIQDPGGNVVATSSGTQVNFRLMANGSPTPGFRISDGTNVASLIVTAATTSGTISQALENNSNIAPGGTYYVAEILCPTSQGGTQEWALLSSSSVSPQNFKDAIAAVIPSFTPITTVPTSVLTGNNIFTGTNQFNGDVSFQSRPFADVLAFANIQDAVASLPATGGCVEIPRGIVTSTGVVNVDRPVTFYGWGNASIIAAASDSYDLFNISSGGSGSQFVGLQIQGGATTTVTGQHGIFSDSSSPATDLTIDRVSFAGPSTTQGLNNAVKFGTGCDNPTVSNVTVTGLIGNLGSGLGAGYAFYGGAIKRGIFSHIRCYGTVSATSSLQQGRHGIYFAAGATSNTYDDIIVDSFNEAGFHIRSTVSQPVCSYNKFSNCHCIDCGGGSNDSAGFQIFGKVEENELNNCTSVRFQGYGMSINNFAVGATLCQSNSMNGCRVYNSNWAGIAVIGGTNTTIQSCRVEDASSTSAGYQAGIVVGSVGSGTQYQTSATRVLGCFSGGSNQRAGIEISAGAPVPVGTHIIGGYYAIGTTTSDVLTNGQDATVLYAGADGVTHTNQPLSIGIGTTSTRPTVTYQGEQWFDSAIKRPIWGTSSGGWQDAAGVLV